MTTKELTSNCYDCVLFLVEQGFADDQNLPFMQAGGDVDRVTYATSQYLNLSLKNIPYEELYSVFDKERVFTARMLDGALLQLDYEISGNRIVRHRLAYLPSPFLRQYAEDRECYEEDQMFAEVVSHRVVPVALRFDVDARAADLQGHPHSESHLTLGQYEHCRIPVSSPLTPSQFCQFVLTSFYWPAYKDKPPLPSPKATLADCLANNDLARIHIKVP